MPLILAFVAIFGSIILANYLVKLGRADLNKIFDWLLFLLNASIFLIGVAIMVLPPQFWSQIQSNIAQPIPDTTIYGINLMGMGVWGMMASLRPSRRLLARRLPIDPTSPVHALALILSGVLAGSTLLTLSLVGLEGFAETAVSTPLADFVIQQFLFVLLALFGVGYLVRRQLPELVKRLGLERPTWPDIRFGLRWIIILVIIQWAVGAIWAITDPEQSELLGGINDILLGNFDTVGEWIIVALGAGIGEELLFRGALQPIFGQLFTSILFAIAHIQYGITPITLLVFFISLALGHVRRRSNTTTAIFVHAGYDLVLGLFYLLAVYLEQFIS